MKNIESVPTETVKSRDRTKDKSFKCNDINNDNYINVTTDLSNDTNQSINSNCKIGFKSSNDNMKLNLNEKLDLNSESIDQSFKKLKLKSENLSIIELNKDSKDDTEDTELKNLKKINKILNNKD